MYPFLLVLCAVLGINRGIFGVTLGQIVYINNKQLHEWDIKFYQNVELFAKNTALGWSDWPTYGKGRELQFYPMAKVLATNLCLSNIVDSKQVVVALPPLLASLASGGEFKRTETPTPACLVCNANGNGFSPCPICVSTLLSSLLCAPEELKKGIDVPKSVASLKECGGIFDKFFSDSKFLFNSENINAILSNTPLLLSSYQLTSDDLESLDSYFFYIRDHSTMLSIISVFLDSPVTIQPSDLSRAYARYLYEFWLSSDSLFKDEVKESIFLKKLKKCGVDINKGRKQTDEGPFLLSLLNNASGISKLKQLVYLGADIWATDEKGESIASLSISKHPLRFELPIKPVDGNRIVGDKAKSETFFMLACKKYHQNKTLIEEFFGNPEIDKKHKDHEGNTFLHFLISQLNLSLHPKGIAILDAAKELELINMENSKKQTVLDLASDAETYRQLVLRGGSIWNSSGRLRISDACRYNTCSIFTVDLFEKSWAANVSLGETHTDGMNILTVLISNNEPSLESIAWLINRDKSLMNKYNLDCYRRRLASQVDWSGPSDKDVELLCLLHEKGYSVDLRLDSLPQDNFARLTKFFRDKNKLPELEKILSEQRSTPSSGRSLVPGGTEQTSTSSAGHIIVSTAAAGRSLVLGGNEASPTAPGGTEQTSTSSAGHIIVSTAAAVGGGLVGGLIVKNLLGRIVARRKQELLLGRKQALAEGKSTKAIDRELALLSSNTLSFKDKAMIAASAVLAAAVVSGSVYHAGARRKEK
jgi:hypothetical protein